MRMSAVARRGAASGRGVRPKHCQWRWSFPFNGESTRDWQFGEEMMRKR